MIDLNELNRYRVVDQKVMEHYGDIGGGEAGCFSLPSPIDKQPLFVIASVSDTWDHVSVSRRNRAPNQTELSHVHRLFFEPGESALQFFLSVGSHINIHENCLHLWRPRRLAIPMPPREFV